MQHRRKLSGWRYPNRDALVKPSSESRKPRYGVSGSYALPDRETIAHGHANALREPVDDSAPQSSLKRDAHACLEAARASPVALCVPLEVAFVALVAVVSGSRRLASASVAAEPGLDQLCPTRCRTVAPLCSAGLAALEPRRSPAFAVVGTWQSPREGGSCARDLWGPTSFEHDG